MPRKNKKDKAAGLEKHKQIQRDKKNKRKERKNIELPTKFKKGRKRQSLDRPRLHEKYLINPSYYSFSNIEGITKHQSSDKNDFFDRS